MKIILQVKIKIAVCDTAYSLYHKLISIFSKNFNKAFKLLINNFDGIEHTGRITYHKRELPYKGIRKFSEITFDEAESFVKAMYFPPFKGAMFELNNGSKIEILHISELSKYKTTIGR